MGTRLRNAAVNHVELAIAAAVVTAMDYSARVWNRSRGHHPNACPHWKRAQSGGGENHLLVDPH
jgi:hypothetical protein